MGKNNFELSLPWSDDEFIQVDGAKLVYDFKRTKRDAEPEMFVKFPGCRSESLASLIASRHRVVMPKHIRHSPKTKVAA